MPLQLPVPVGAGRGIAASLGQARTHWDRGFDAGETMIVQSPVRDWQGAYACGHDPVGRYDERDGDGGGACYRAMS